MMPRRSAALVALAALMLLPACALLERPGPYGNSARKEPLHDESTVFAQALLGPISPEEPLEDGVMVGWFGVVLETETNDAGITGIVLDHRYADEINIRYGYADTRSIHTVSLFGGGLFETATTYADAPKEWVAGDLLRVYGTVSKSDTESVRVAPIYLRHWPRWAYEVAPLLPVWNGDGTIARKRGAWPELRWDVSVASKESPVDDLIRAALIERFPVAALELKTHIAYTLGELGGDEATLALDEAIRAETDPDRRRIYERCLRRARRDVGPRWDPTAPNPYWQDTVRLE